MPDRKDTCIGEFYVARSKYTKGDVCSRCGQDYNHIGGPYCSCTGCWFTCCEDCAGRVNELELKHDFVSLKQRGAFAEENRKR